MMFMGSIVNGLTIIGGSLLGLILHNISANAKDTITKSLGLGTFALGIQMALQTKSFIVIIISLCLGGLLGEWLHIEDGMNHLGLKLQERFARNNSHFAEGFVTATLIAVIGAMSILGAIQAGVSGDNATLYTKAVMDGFMAIMMTASLGIGVLFSAIPVILYQGTITLLASFLVQFIPVDGNLTSRNWCHWRVDDPRYRPESHGHHQNPHFQPFAWASSLNWHSNRTIFSIISQSQQKAGHHGLLFV